VTSIPHGFLFDADGALVAEPHPAEVEAAIEELQKRIPAAMLGAGPYVKLAKLVAQIRKGKDAGATMKKVRAKTSSKDEAEAAEAKMLIESLTGAVEKQIDSALDDKETNPAGSVKTLERLALQFDGDDLGAKARFDLDNLKKDPGIKKIVESEAAFKKIEVLIGKLKAYDGAKDPKSEGFRKLNAATLTEMSRSCEALIEGYPETVPAKKAQDILAAIK
jgi:hypothetical protein